MNKPLKGFIAYSHDDTAQKNELRKRLSVMEQQNELSTWDDGQLTPGDEALQEDILKKLVDSDLLLYLVSAGSLASINCNSELAAALNQEIDVISIILEHCDWQRHQIRCFEVLPCKGKPLTKWEDLSEGWQNVVDGIWKVVNKIRTTAESSSENTRNDQQAESAFRQGNTFVMIDQIDRAIEIYSHAIELNSKHAEYYYNRGISYDENNQPDLAIKDYTKVIELNPEYAGAYNNRGNLYVKRGEYDLAISDFTKYIELNPKNILAYQNRVFAYNQKGEYDLANKDYKKIMELNPKDIVDPNNSTIVIGNLKDFAMDNHQNFVPLSQQPVLEKMRQDYGETDYITVYRLGEGFPNYGHFVLCGLLPSTLVNEMLSDKTYISKVIEDVWVEPFIPPDVPTYNRWGSEGDQNGFEPLIIKRRYGRLNVDYVEISEEFRLFHDLYHDRDTETYINSEGETIVDIIILDGGYEVKMRLAEIQSFLTAKQLFLSLLFEVNEYSTETLDSLGLETSSEREFHSKGLFCWVYQYRDAKRFSEFESNRYIRGRRFIPPAS